MGRVGGTIRETRGGRGGVREVGSKGEGKERAKKRNIGMGMGRDSKLLKKYRQQSPYKTFQKYFFI